MKQRALQFLILALSTQLFFCCNNDPAASHDTINKDAEIKANPDALLQYLPSSQTGIEFNNKITETTELNYFTYQYVYNGGGVAAGDLNNDGLVDLYFTGNLVGDKLYMNKGSMQFEDVTDQALPGLPNTWHQGVTMADVNDDGHLDIYVCRSGFYKEYDKTSNLFWVNNGDGTFTERAAEYGIADTTRSTQAAFFDVEGDGDLDLFVMNTPLHNKGISNVARQNLIMRGIAPSDRFYRNDNGKFSDVSAEFGIRNYGYGLGLNVSDINQDGAPDVYESNDYDMPDLMYMNRGTTFSEELQQRTRHISNFGMGCDIADYNNDGFPDIMVLDMVSEDHVRNKINMAGMSTDRFWKLVRVGYHKQYMSNTLQLNNGNGSFSEVAQIAGVAQTDWSWSALFADMDNDGWKDLLVTNGYKRDMRNNDFAGKFEDYLESSDKAQFGDILELIPATRIKNYAFRNKGDLTFENSSENWGMNIPVNSNGMVYADLDNDGDLDLVINNIDEPASIMQNSASENGAHYLRLKLKTGNRDALGARVTLWRNGKQQYQELAPTRGYQSCVEPLVHFGLGQDPQIDSIRIEWPNGKSQFIEDCKADQVLSLKEGGTLRRAAISDKKLFEYVEAKGLSFVHAEDPYNDFEKELLLPHKYSAQGPHLSVGDANGDGLDDVFVSGAHLQSSELYLQREDGTFKRQFDQAWEMHAIQEQLGSAFLDVDADGDQDLIVLAGGNQYDVRNEMYHHRLYRNNGRGKFEYDDNALPPMATSGGRIAVGDVNGDNIPDLFIGGRVTPGMYPFAPRSYLLANDGKGKFIDVTATRAKDLMGPGMITDAAFGDIDSDGDNDLIICGEWMPMSVYENTGQGFINSTDKYQLGGTLGWWKSVALVDIDNDDDLDIVGGNIGLNNKFQCDATHPLHVYWGDFDENGRNDIVLAKEKGNRQLPVRGKQCSSEQCPIIEENFPTFEEFAHADLAEIYGSKQLEKALHLQATHMASTLFINQGGEFSMQALPKLAQLAPLNRILVSDVNGDGFLDLIAAGNDWDAEVETVAHDAGSGVVLINDGGTGHFEALPSHQSGFAAWNHVKDLALITRAGIPMIIVANNNAPLELFAQRPAN